jgi:hypothetical protein
MRSVTRALVVVGLLVARNAAADVAPATASATTTAPASSASASAPAPASSRAGLAVLALPGATDAAWPLAQAVYADPSLRPGAVDEPHARVLCGEAPATGDAAELRDLSETVAAVHGDDAPSRSLLDGIARSFSVRGILVVRSEAGHASARVFLAETGGFDAATYAPDDTTPATAAITWAAATRSLDRLMAPPAPGPHAAGSAVAPPLATRAAPKVESSSSTPRPFYESFWFWGAVGAAALAGGAAYFATRDTSASTIHLEVQVPH